MVLIFFAPESPWWLTRKGRTDQALRSLQRLGNSSENHGEKLAMIERTVEIEAKLGGTPSLLDLFKGTDLRRTTITCLMYASQNFAGNLIANQATFFFERKYSCVQIMRFAAKLFNRGWHEPRLLLPTRPDQQLSGIHRQRRVLVPYRLVRSPYHLPVGHCCQRHPSRVARHLRLHHPEQRDQLRPSHSGNLDFLRLRWRHGPDLLLHHRRSLFSPTPCSQYWRRSWCILCKLPNPTKRIWIKIDKSPGRRNSDDLPRVANAQHHRLEHGWQVWLRLGRHRSRLLDHGLLLLARVQAPLLPRA